MNKQNKLNTIFAIFIALTLVLACSGDQQEEANKLAAEGNRKLEEARILADKTEARNTKLFSASIQTVSQLNAYKLLMKDEAKSIVDDYTKVSDMLKEISQKFDEASRLNVKDLYKQYVKIKAEEFTKRAEAFAVRRGNAQAFIEIDSPKVMTDKFAENNENFEKLMKEAVEIGERAKKMEADNKDFFKELK